MTGKNGFVDSGSEFLFRQDEAGPGTAKRFVRGGGDDIGMLARVGINASRHQAGIVSHINQEDCANGVGNFSETGEIDNTSIGAGSGDDHLRPMLLSKPLEFVVVDEFVVFANAVGDNFVQFAGEIEVVAVGKVASMRQVHAEDGVARLKNGRVGGGVRLRAGMGLHVGVLGAKQLLRPIARQCFDLIGELTAAVVAPSGITLGVFIRENASGCLQDSFGSEVFACDQFQTGVLAVQLLLYCSIHVWIHLGQRPA